ncbi:MAG: hypothetical protein DRH24_14920 [Deltaproteobacteria bacterium]|nr:MAG: hypothetical protein DRH24_14920 [Deltaproteobacteria bacterium]
MKTKKFQPDFQKRLSAKRQQTLGHIIHKKGVIPYLPSKSSLANETTYFLLFHRANHPEFCWFPSDLFTQLNRVYPVQFTPVTSAVYLTGAPPGKFNRGDLCLLTSDLRPPNFPLFRPVLSFLIGFPDQEKK